MASRVPQLYGRGAPGGPPRGHLLPVDPAVQLLLLPVLPVHLLQHLLLPHQRRLEALAPHAVTAGLAGG